MSLGGGKGQTSMISAVNNAVENGIVTVVSAGNSGPSWGNVIGSPGDADNVITVAASSRVDNVTYYSSMGGNSYTNFTTKPDITARGGSPEENRVFSADTNDNDQISSCPCGVGCVENYFDEEGYLNDLKKAYGTSMAAPAVAGAVNLLIDAMGGVKNWNFTGEEAKK